MNRIINKYPLAIAAANRLIKYFSLSKPEHIILDLIAAEHNVFIKEGAIKGSRARLVCHRKSGIITIDNKISLEGQKRFAIAHELGHYLLHKNMNQLHQCDEKMMLNWYRERSEESEANVFASELLMPEKMFSQYCEGKAPNFTTISELAGFFRTSFTATAMRYVTYTDYPCVLIVVENKIVKWFDSNKSFPYRVIAPGEKISKNSCAFDFYEYGTKTSEPEPVIGSAWLEDWRSGKDVLLYEQMRVFPNYGLVISLLWPDEF